MWNRNLSPMQRIAIAEKYRELYEKQAKEKQIEAGKEYGNGKEKVTPNLVEATTRTANETNTKLAKVANVGKETYRQAKKILDSGDEELKKAVMSQESNLRQRVLGNANPVKLGRCFEFLNDWYGFKEGNNQYSLSNNFTSTDEPHNQTELAESYKITKQTMNNYMRLAEMIPELEELLDTGIVTKTTVLAVMKQQPTSSVPRTMRRKSVKSQRSM